ncbi:transmembrane protein [Cystoisospora suis]|uniref:Transmembrane protein n=1 Tax=Cystoisospora suis TaxID=483139 RepID=A0A2C6LIP2_9APIC|nr:transmembrane protein [Cystoisospora suis]
MEYERSPCHLQCGDAERSGSCSPSAALPPTASSSYCKFWEKGEGGPRPPLCVYCEKDELEETSAATISRRKRRIAVLAMSKQTAGIALFGLTCLGQGSYGSLTGFLGSYLHYFGSDSSVAFQQMLLVTVLQGGVQALIAPFSVKLLACFPLPLCALFSGWILSGSLLLAGFLLSPTFLPSCRTVLFYIVYAGVGGLGGGLMHGLPFGGRRTPADDSLQDAKSENCATGVFFACRCLSAALIPLLHSFVINPENLSPAAIAPVTGQARAGIVPALPNTRPGVSAEQQFIGWDSWASRERFYLHEELLRRVPLTLMGLGAALALIQLVGAFFVKEKQATVEVTGPRVAVVEEESRLITHISIWPAYGDSEKARSARMSPSCANHTASPEACPKERVPGCRTSGGSDLCGAGLEGPRERVPAFCLVGGLTALHAMASGLVQSSWRFVGQEEFLLSDQAVAYSNAGSIVVLLLFAFFFAPPFTRVTDPETQPSFFSPGDVSLRPGNNSGNKLFTCLSALWSISGLLLVGESFAAELSRFRPSHRGATAFLEGWRAFLDGSIDQPSRTIIFFLWLSAVRISDAW